MLFTAGHLGLFHMCISFSSHKVQLIWKVVLDILPTKANWYHPLGEGMTEPLSEVLLPGKVCMDRRALAGYSPRSWWDRLKRLLPTFISGKHQKKYSNGKFFENIFFVMLLASLAESTFATGFLSCRWSTRVDFDGNSFIFIPFSKISLNCSLQVIHCSFSLCCLYMGKESLLC